VKYWSAMMWPLQFECFAVLHLVVVLKSWPKYWLLLRFCMVFLSLPPDSRWDITWNYATTATFHILRNLLNTLVDPEWLCCDTLQHYDWVVKHSHFVSGSYRLVHHKQDLLCQLKLCVVFNTYSSTTIIETFMFLCITY